MRNRYLYAGGLYLLLLALALPSGLGAQCTTIIDVDFDNHSDKRYTIQDAFNDFNNKVKPWTAAKYRGIEGPGGTSSLYQDTPQETRIVSGELRAEYLKDRAGGTNGGFLFDAYFDGVEEAYLEYTVRFEPGFEWDGGGKLPGLGGTNRGVGTEVGSNGTIPSGGQYNDDGFSARLMWRRAFNGQPTPQGNPYFILYSYFSRRQTNNGDLRSTTTRQNGDNYRFFNDLQRDVPYKIKQYIKLNDPGQANGTVKIWVDDNIAFDRDDMEIRRKSSVKINSLIMQTYRGGGADDPRWYTANDEYAYFDNFRVWTGSENYCGGGGSGGATPDVASVSVSDDVVRGQTANVNVTYSAGNNQDVWVNFQLDQSPWTSYASARINAVPGANNTVTIPVSIPSNVPIANDAYQFQVVVAPDGGSWNERLANRARNNVDVVASGGGGQSAFNGPHAIPGRIQAEWYDNGGQGVAYNDSNTQNSGGAGRTNEGVDVANIGGSSEAVGWTSNGEWLEYTIANVSAGTYQLRFRTSTNLTGTRSISASLNGQSLATRAITNTGGWESYQDFVVSNVSISGGSNQVLRLTFNGGGVNLNYVDFVQTGGASLAGTYRLKNVGSGGYLDSDGVNVKVGTSSSGSDKQWGIVQSAGSNYNIDSKFSGRGMLETAAGRVVRGTSTEPTSTTNRFEWTFEEIAPGEWLIKSVERNEYLAQVSGGTGIEWHPWNGARSRWILEPVGGSSHQVANNGSDLEAGGIVTPQAAGEQLRVYPNPASTVLNVAGLTEADATVRVYDLAGRMVSSQATGAAPAVRLDVSTLKAGTYFVRVSDGRSARTHRFVKR